ncbi:MAG TPA: helix-turn-helix transcriptional regulator [Kofleriaceae bacterium]|jgi:transcriptional regulator with XRE-family HTH domain|nr:helix-turn-helix transcriptional regulator [Kofleriaceae bacterium]
MPDDGLRKLGALIRSCRSAAQLTQAELGRRAGIVGKYVSEIERGTRDVPFSTLRAIAEDGLGLVLDVNFRPSVGRVAAQDEIPAAVAGLARDISALAPDQRVRVIAIVKILLRLANR